MEVKDKLIKEEIVDKAGGEKFNYLKGLTYEDAFKALQKRGFEIKIEKVDLKKWLVRSISGFDWLIIGNDLQFCLDKTIEAIIKQYYVHNR